MKAVFIALSFALISSPLAGGAASPLDPSFGRGGKVLTDFSGDTEDAGLDVAAQTDGKIVVVGLTGTDSTSNAHPTFALARYQLDGGLDPRFGGDGKVRTDFTPTTDEVAYATAIQPDGKILAAGAVWDGVSFRGFALARYNGDGTLDTGFDGDGTVVTDFGSGSAGAFAIALQRDGKIVLAGFASSGPDPSGIALVRYTSSGSLDRSFDGDGKLITPVSLGSSSLALDVVVQPDGLIVVGGRSLLTRGQSGAALVRYLSDGRLDGSFDGDGKVEWTTDAGASINAIALQQDGRIVTVGEPDGSLTRFKANGSLDTSFSGDGTSYAPLVEDIWLQDAAVQPDGKIVASGSVLLTDPARFDFAVARWTASGGPDRAFGRGGALTVDFGGDDGAMALALLPKGKIVVAGEMVVLRGSRDGRDIRDIALARILGIQVPPRLCVVPNVKGRTLAQARRLLVSKRCALGRVAPSHSQTVRKGRVISQMPSVGRRLTRGAKVHVKVSRGRRPPR